MRRTGRDAKGRYVPSGSPRESFDFGYFVCRPESIGTDIVLLGRLVDQARVYPKRAD